MFPIIIVGVVTITELAYIDGTFSLYCLDLPTLLNSQGILFAWHCRIYHQCIQQGVSINFVANMYWGYNRRSADLLHAFIELEV